VPDQRDDSPGGQLEIEVVQHWAFGVVAEGDAIEGDEPRARR